MSTPITVIGAPDEGDDDMSKVPNTISDADWADLRRRARTAEPPFLSDEAIRRRHAANAQSRNAHLN